jgi:hypothetical protein
MGLNANRALAAVGRAAHGSDDDTTMLSRAGDFIAKHAPDVTAKAYGLGTLKQILLASKLFEVRCDNAGGPVWYRSTPEFARLPLQASAQEGLSFSLVRPTSA